MIKRTIQTLAIAATVIVLALSTMAFTRVNFNVDAPLTGRGGPGGGNGGGRGTGSGSGSVTSPSLVPLSDAEKNALNQAILEEYGALNLYTSVINQLGNVVPFSTIAAAEQQHVNALVRQMVKYGLAVPSNPGLSTKLAFTTLAEACSAGVSAETADAALYDQLMANVTHTDLLQVFSNLQSASLNNHLPAFQACD